MVNRQHANEQQQEQEQSGTTNSSSRSSCPRSSSHSTRRRMRMRRLGLLCAVVCCGCTMCTTIRSMLWTQHSLLFRNSSSISSSSISSSNKYHSLSVAESRNSTLTPVSSSMIAGDSQKQQEQQQQHRPWLVLHIGPHKTATSSIQCSLSHFFARQQQQQPRKEDPSDFIYLGRHYGECQPYTNIHNNNNNNSNTKQSSLSSSSQLWSVDTRRLVTCLDHHTPSHPCNKQSEWQRFEQTLAQLAQQNQNVILSDEALSRLKQVDEHDTSLRLLWNALRKHYHVRLVLGYRHYFSWLLSQYNEHYKPLPSRKQYQRWPDESGGSHMRTFVEYYQRQQQQQQQQQQGPNNNNNSSTIASDRLIDSAAAKGDYQLAAERSDLHPVAYLWRRWSRALERTTLDGPNTVTTTATNNHNHHNHNPQVTAVVINLHDEELTTRGGGDDITGYFIRQALSPQAYETYVHAKQTNTDHTPPSRPNPSWNLDYNRLAVAAREMGLFRTTSSSSSRSTLSRPRVSHWVQELVQQQLILTNNNNNNNNTSPTPRTCLNATQLEEFLQRSLQLEQTVFGAASSMSLTTTTLEPQMQQQRHTAAFVQYVQENQFCNLDVQTVLQQDATVREVFGLLNTIQV